jgi:hypothetical protein
MTVLFAAMKNTRWPVTRLILSKMYWHGCNGLRPLEKHNNSYSQPF